MGISTPEKRIDQYPHEFSGGMRQRAMIAMAMSCSPKVLIADEPTTALDVTIQAQIFELMEKLKREHDTAIMLITHDMGVVSELESVKSICDFEYMNKEECLDKLNAGKLYAVMEVPEGFVQDIMNGTNTPVKILLPRGTGLESRIFKELTDAGASTLGAGQAGIYAGDELLYLDRKSVV